MPSAFAVAAASLFSDPNLSRDAVYRAAGTGPAVAVRLVLRRPDQTSEFGGGRFVTGSHILKVPVESIPDLQRGDTFECDLGTFEVRGEPRRDGFHVVWMVEAQEL